MTDWAQRFEAFVDRKEREAAAATLPPLRTAEVGAIERLAPLGDPWTRRLFDGDFYLSPAPHDVPATSLVFVQSKDGNTGARNPSTLGGGETDKHVVYEGLSRVAADGVLAGAETIRGVDVVFSVWRRELVELRDAMHLPRHPTQIIATLHGLPFDQTLLFNVPEVPVIVLTIHSCADVMSRHLARHPWITVIEMDRPSELRQAFQRLRTMGIGRVSCIGGRTMARALIDAGLVQDLYLTTSPREGGEPNTPITPTPLEGKVIVRKHGTGPDEGVVFEHLLLG